MNTGVTMKTFPLDIELMTGNKKRKEYNMIKCGLCGKDFEDDHFEEYAAHTNHCAAEMSLKKKTEDMKKIQAELEDVKRAKVVYEGLRDSFKEKYPDIYKINFPEDDVIKSKCICDKCEDIKKPENDNNKDNNKDKDEKDTNKDSRTNRPRYFDMYSPFHVSYNPTDSDELPKLSEDGIDEYVDELLDFLTGGLGYKYKKRH